jgi:hypothetical protein
MNMYKMNPDMSFVNPKNIALFSAFKTKYLTPNISNINATNWN